MNIMTKKTVWRNNKYKRIYASTQKIIYLLGAILGLCLTASPDIKPGKGLLGDFVSNYSIYYYIIPVVLILVCIGFVIMSIMQYKNDALYDFGGEGKDKEIRGQDSL